VGDGYDQYLAAAKQRGISGLGESMRGRPFPKGTSGNPAGRPPGGKSIAEYIRNLAGDDGRQYLDCLHAIATAEDQSTRVRIAAIAVLLDRGFGKAPQAMPDESQARSSFDG
jgi:hypothetical protein